MAAMPQLLLSLLLGMLCILPSIATDALSLSDRQRASSDMNPAAVSNWKGHFVFPNADRYMFFQEGSKINISWSTVFPSFDVRIAQYPNWKKTHSITADTTQKYFQWTVDVSWTSNLSAPFRFHVTNTSAIYPNTFIAGFWSSGFYLTNPSSTQTPLTGPSGSLLPTDDGDSGLSSGAKAGIGIGVAIGALLLLAALGFGVLHWRRKRQQRLASTDVGSEKAPVIPWLSFGSSVGGGSTKNAGAQGYSSPESMPSNPGAYAGEYYGPQTAVSSDYMSPERLPAQLIPPLVEAPRSKTPPTVEAPLPKTPPAELPAEEVTQEMDAVRAPAIRLNSDQTLHSERR